ncbi:hypothetical protein HNY73_010221 [Argiope bruennichi]|uniref:Uncharacterized protein n=1 Tax=Argiope bruennichi TaxID=94029 RepID=A0A8T0F569_ARGBR|nr:hypothetical protein HNY73_010221 [Argiope bruennichi]
MNARLFRFHIPSRESSFSMHCISSETGILLLAFILQWYFLLPTICRQYGNIGDKIPAPGIYPSMMFHKDEGNGPPPYSRAANRSSEGCSADVYADGCSCLNKKCYSAPSVLESCNYFGNQCPPLISSIKLGDLHRGFDASLSSVVAANRSSEIYSADIYADGCSRLNKKCYSAPGNLSPYEKVNPSSENPNKRAATYVNIPNIRPVRGVVSEIASHTSAEVNDSAAAQKMQNENPKAGPQNKVSNIYLSLSDDYFSIIEAIMTRYPDTRSFLNETHITIQPISSNERNKIIQFLDEREEDYFTTEPPKKQPIRPDIKAIDPHPSADGKATAKAMKPRTKNTKADLQNKVPIIYLSLSYNLDYFSTIEAIMTRFPDTRSFLKKTHITVHPISSYERKEIMKFLDEKTVVYLSPENPTKRPAICTNKAIALDTSEDVSDTEESTKIETPVQNKVANIYLSVKPPNERPIRQDIKGIATHPSADVNIKAAAINTRTENPNADLQNEDLNIYLSLSKDYCSTIETILTRYPDTRSFLNKTHITLQPVSSNERNKIIQFLDEREEDYFTTEPPKKQPIRPDIKAIAPHPSADGKATATAMKPRTENTKANLQNKVPIIYLSLSYNLDYFSTIEALMTRFPDTQSFLKKTHITVHPISSYDRKEIMKFLDEKKVVYLSPENPNKRPAICTNKAIALDTSEDVSDTEESTKIETPVQNKVANIYLSVSKDIFLTIEIIQSRFPATRSLMNKRYVTIQPISSNERKEIIKFLDEEKEAYFLTEPPNERPIRQDIKGIATHPSADVNIKAAAINTRTENPNADLQNEDLNIYLSLSKDYCSTIETILTRYPDTRSFLNKTHITIQPVSSNERNEIIKFLDEKEEVYLKTETTNIRAVSGVVSEIASHTSAEVSDSAASQKTQNENPEAGPQNKISNIYLSLSNDYFCTIEAIMTRFPETRSFLNETYITIQPISSNERNKIIKFLNEKEVYFTTEPPKKQPDRPDIKAIAPHPSADGKATAAAINTRTKNTEADLQNKVPNIYLTLSSDYFSTIEAIMTRFPETRSFLNKTRITVQPISSYERNEIIKFLDEKEVVYISPENPEKRPAELSRMFYMDEGNGPPPFSREAHRSSGCCSTDVYDDGCSSLNKKCYSEPSVLESCNYFGHQCPPLISWKKLGDLHRGFDANLSSVVATNRSSEFYYADIYANGCSRLNKKCYSAPSVLESCDYFVHLFQDDFNLISSKDITYLRKKSFNTSIYRINTIPLKHNCHSSSYSLASSTCIWSDNNDSEDKVWYESDALTSCSTGINYSGNSHDRYIQGNVSPRMNYESYSSPSGNSASSKLCNETIRKDFNAFASSVAGIKTHERKNWESSYDEYACDSDDSSIENDSNLTPYASEFHCKWDDASEEEPHVLKAGMAAVSHYRNLKNNDALRDTNLCQDKKPVDHMDFNEESQCKYEVNTSSISATNITQKFYDRKGYDDTNLCIQEESKFSPVIFADASTGARWKYAPKSITYSTAPINHNSKSHNRNSYDDGSSSTQNKYNSFPCDRIGSLDSGNLSPYEKVNPSSENPNKRAATYVNKGIASRTSDDVGDRTGDTEIQNYTKHTIIQNEVANIYLRVSRDIFLTIEEIKSRFPATRSLLINNYITIQPASSNELNEIFKFLDDKKEIYLATETRSMRPVRNVVSGIAPHTSAEVTDASAAKKRQYENPEEVLQNRIPKIYLALNEDYWRTIVAIATRFPDTRSFLNKTHIAIQPISLHERNKIIKFLDEREEDYFTTEPPNKKPIRPDIKGNDPHPFAEVSDTAVAKTTQYENPESDLQSKVPIIYLTLSEDYYRTIVAIATRFPKTQISRKETHIRIQPISSNDRNEIIKFLDEKGEFYFSLETPNK